MKLSKAMEVEMLTIARRNSNHQAWPWDASKRQRRTLEALERRDLIEWIDDHRAQSHGYWLTDKGRREVQRIKARAALTESHS